MMASCKGSNDNNGVAVYPSSSTIGKDFDEDVRPLINIVDQLRAIGVGNHIDLPTVAVVGDQSSGKSSVLEAISGVPLPRGAEIVTRCPLEMQMKKSSSPWSAEISFTEKNKAEPTTWPVKSPDEVSTLIEEATNTLAGPGKEVSEDLIHLRISSPEAPDLTLIDLPGIVHSTEGKQSKDVITCVRNLLIKYMKQENTIILCVYPGNMEVANCAVFDMAHEHDPEAKRTMAITTKPDLVTENDQKTRLIQRMTDGSVYKLRSFYIVKGRSPEELRQGISREELLQREKRFFERDELYRKIDPDMRGFPSLMRALTYRLVKHIKECLPGVRATLKSMLRETRDQYQKLPPPLPSSDVDKKAYLTTSFMKFIRDVESALESGKEYCLWEADPVVLAVVARPAGGGPFVFGTSSSPAVEFSMKNESSTMFAVWRVSFDRFVSKLVKRTESKLVSNGDWEQSKLLAYLQRHRGDELPTFPNFTSFKKLISEHLEYYKTCADDCVNDIYEDLLEFIRFYTKRHFSEHPGLCEEVLEMAFNTAEKCLADTKEKIAFAFKKEKLGYCQDMTFLRLTKQEEELRAAKYANVTAVSGMFSVASKAHNETDSNALLDRSQIARQVQDNLRIYFTTANQRLGDDIPNTIRVGLHYEFASSFTDRLLPSIERPEMQHALVREDIYKHERTRLKKKLHRLDKGHKLLEDFQHASQLAVQRENVAC